MKAVAIIPAHMASIRFPGKILFPILGLPMIEHVRRRALMANSIAEVIVATCDKTIASIVHNFGGRVVMTSDTHKNGTSRVAEAVSQMSCTHVMLLQGDEPLVLPRHIDGMVKAVQAHPVADVWNATGPIEYVDELDRPSFVKCIVSKHGRIMLCFRRTPAYCSFDQQKLIVRKILGLIMFRREFLLKIQTLEVGILELTESIEQMRILEHDFHLQSVPLSLSSPSVNEPHEIEAVLKCIEESSEQRHILKNVFAYT